MPTINFTLEIGSAELLAEVAIHPVKASGDGWNEPHEPAHAETWISGMWIIRSQFDRATGRMVPVRTKFECPELAEAILEATQDEADAEAVEYLADDGSDERYDAWRDREIDGRVA